jgi:hypothetical protein
MRIASRRPFRIGRAKSGLGLFATKPIKKGAFIIQYWGRRLRNNDADELETKYLFELNSRWTIDGSPRRNIARYINHSCRPNAETDVVKGKVLITAYRNIQQGDEITYDYGKDYFNTFIKPHGCRCAKCTDPKVRAALRRKKSKQKKAKTAKRA